MSVRDARSWQRTHAVRGTVLALAALAVVVLVSITPATALANLPILLGGAVLGLGDVWLQRRGSHPIVDERSTVAAIAVGVVGGIVGPVAFDVAPALFGHAVLGFLVPIACYHGYAALPARPPEATSE